jgi:hypothetical protein
MRPLFGQGIQARAADAKNLPNVFFLEALYGTPGVAIARKNRDLYLELPIIHM